MSYRRTCLLRLKCFAGELMIRRGHIVVVVEMIARPSSIYPQRQCNLMKIHVDPTGDPTLYNISKETLSQTTVQLE